MFETDDRRLEQFLFAHLIRFDSQFKNAHGRTVWRYRKTARLSRVVREYKALQRPKFIASLK